MQGGGYRIAITLIDKFGRERIQAAVVTASFIIGIALFFEVGLILLIPIVYVIAKELNVPFLYLGIPMAAALNVTHGFLPPHPAPTAISVAYGADIGQVLLLGIMIAIPTTVIAGPLFNQFAMKRFPNAYLKSGNLSALGPKKEFKLDETPGFAISVVTSLLPVIFMAIATIFSFLKEIRKARKSLNLSVHRGVRCCFPFCLPFIQWVMRGRFPCRILVSLYLSPFHRLP